MKTKTLMRWHSKLGIYTGVVLFIVALTGIVLLFQDNLMWLGYEHQANSKHKTLDELYTVVENNFPNHDINGFRFLGSKTEPITVVIDSCDISKYVYIDPFTGNFVEPNATINSFLDISHNLHTGFIASSIGIFIVFIASLAYLILTITGIILFRKNIKKALLFKIKKGKKKSRYFHYMFGVWTIPFNFLLAISGIYLIVPQFIGSLIGSGAYHSGEAIPAKNNPLLTISLDSVLTKTHNSYPDFELNYLRMPTSANDLSLKLWGNLPKSWHTGELATEIFYNVNTNEFNITRESEHSFGTQVALALHTIHVGQFGGFIVKIIYTLFTLLLIVLNITGYLLFYRRSKLKR